MEILHGLESCANAEKQRLKESQEAAEDRVSYLELSRLTLEGELQRARLKAAGRDAEAGALQERLTDTRRKLGENEDQCSALRAREERLAVSLTRAEQRDSELREQIHKLLNTLGNNRMSIEGQQEQTAELQRALTASEQDRRLLQVQSVTLLHPSFNTRKRIKMVFMETIFICVSNKQIQGFLNGAARWCPL